MIEDITLNPQNPINEEQAMQRQRQRFSPDGDMVSEQQMQMNAAGGVKCPNCGTVNDPRPPSAHPVAILSAGPPVRTVGRTLIRVQTSVSHAADM